MNKSVIAFTDHYIGFFEFLPFFALVAIFALIMPDKAQAFAGPRRIEVQNIGEEIEEEG